MKRRPCAALAPFVVLLWATEDDSRGLAPTRPPLEHALPTGLMHLVIRRSDHPLVLQGPDEPVGHLAAPALVGGARLRFYRRRPMAPSGSVGAVLRPGVSPLLFGEGADVLADRHTALGDLWGSAAASLRLRLIEAHGAARRIDLLEAHLAARLPIGMGVPPEAAHLLRLLRTAADVRDAVALSGLAHRRFIARFRHAVGLAPKAYLRVRRFRHALQLLRAPAAGPLAEIAMRAGYADQSHLGREFVELAGVTPATYRNARPPAASHLPRPD